MSNKQAKLTIENKSTKIKESKTILKEYENKVRELIG